MKKLIKINHRICSACGNRLEYSGYVIEDGKEYYCSEKCLHSKISEDEWIKLYDDGNGTSYWTEWNDCDFDDELKINSEVPEKVIKHYVHNLKTSRIELHFTKEEYDGLSKVLKEAIKKSFFWSGSAKTWVSRSTTDHYRAIQTAKMLGFVEEVRQGERLTHADRLQLRASKAEARAARYDVYSEKALKRGIELQSPLMALQGDIAFFTQPIYQNHSGSQSFEKRRERILNKYREGFEEYRKSEYFKKQSESLRAAASMSELNNKAYVSRRIQECSSNLRKFERKLSEAEKKNNQEWEDRLIDFIDVETDKLAFYNNILEELGGIQFNNEKVKVGYQVKIRDRWYTVLKVNKLTVSVKPIEENLKSFELKYPYSEVQELKEKEISPSASKATVQNIFLVGDIFIRYNIAGNLILIAFQCISMTAKTVMVQKIQVINNIPQQDLFVAGSKPERKTPKKNRQGEDVLIDGDYYLYKYISQANAI